MIRAQITSKLVLITLIILPAIISCRKFIELPPPPNQIISTSVFKDAISANSAVVGLYSEMTKTNLNFANGGLTVYPALSADELFRTTANSTTDVFSLNEIPSNSSVLRTSFWVAPFSYIYHLNAILEGLNSSKSIPDSIKKQLIGEVKLTRAFCYIYLVNIYGDVPLILSTDYRVNSIMPRAKVQQVYDQIIQDLLEAKSSLNENYPSFGRMRPNKWVAVSLLARVYLYRKEWQKAESEASSIINSGVYSLALITSPLSSSNEVIWQLNRENLNTAEGAAFIPSSASIRPTYSISDSLLNAFESGDQRKVNWVKKVTISGVTYAYPFKYKIGNSTIVSERLIVLRYAEPILIRAEARIAQNNVNEAVSDLNLIRTRAGLPPILASGTTEYIANAIQKERRIEFFAEWGHRWFDLKRTGSANQVLSNLKPNTWQPTDELYPIPLTELELNPFLIQNPGY